MKTFNQFVEEVAYTPAVRQMTKKLVESGIDPVKYAYLRLVENVPPQQAAAQAPGAPAAGNPTADIGQLAQAVNGILQKYGKTMPNVGKVVTGMNQEVQKLTAAAQQDAQAAQQPQAGVTPAPQAGAPAAPAAPGASPGTPPAGMPGQMPVPGQAKPGQVPQQPPKPGQPQPPAAR